MCQAGLDAGERALPQVLPGLSGPSMTGVPAGPLLTLEPLIEAVREGVERVGWSLSGLQKTTSHQFEGRWSGEESRSAYLFFHPEHGPDRASVDVFLDETARGLSGNLALVVDGRNLEGLEPTPRLMERLAGVASHHLPEGYRTPLVLRLHLDRMETPAGRAGSECRFKLRLPRTVMEAGHAATAALASATVRAFERILEAPDLRVFLSEG